MVRLLQPRSIRLAVCALAALAVLTGTTVFAADQMTRPFTGKAVNGGTVTASERAARPS
jgi:hypothetical protein